MHGPCPRAAVLLIAWPGSSKVCDLLQLHLSTGDTQSWGEQRVGPPAPAAVVAHLPVQAMTNTSTTFEFTQTNLEGFHCSSSAQCYLQSCLSLPSHFWGCLQTPTLPTLIQGTCQQGRHALLGKGHVSLSSRLQLSGRLKVEPCTQVMLPAFLPGVQKERQIHFAILWERTGVAQCVEIQGAMACTAGSPRRARKQRHQQSHKHLNWLNVLDKISLPCNLYLALSRVGYQMCSPNKGDLHDILLQSVPLTPSPCTAAQPTSFSCS